MDLTWSQFRRAHKGMPQTEVSDLWSQYKEGKYKPKDEVENDPYEDFNEAYNIVFGGKVVSEEAAREAKTLLYGLVEETSPSTTYLSLIHI